MHPGVFYQQMETLGSYDLIRSASTGDRLMLGSGLSISHIYYLLCLCLEIRQHLPSTRRNSPSNGPLSQLTLNCAGPIRAQLCFRGSESRELSPTRFAIRAIDILNSGQLEPKVL